MKPAAFEYHRATSVEHAVELLAGLEGQDVEAKVIAGGQSLVPLMNLRLARPEHLVDIYRLDELQGVAVDGDVVRIGALTRHADLEDSGDLRARMPLLPEVAAHIGYRQIRTRGTVGGSLCHADPAAEWPMVSVLVDAQLVVQGAEVRRVPARAFFPSLFTSALEPWEVLTHVEIPARVAGSRFGFSEYARKRGEFAMVAAAARIATSDGTVTGATIALAGASSTPVWFDVADVAGSSLEEAAASEVTERVGAGARDRADPVPDIHASAEFRGQLVEVQARRAWQRACLAPSSKE